MGNLKSKIRATPSAPVRRPFNPRIYHMIEKTRCMKHAPGTVQLKPKKVCSICGRSPRRRMCNDRCDHVYCFFCIEEYVDLDNVAIGSALVCPDDQCTTIVHAVRFCRGVF